MKEFKAFKTKCPHCGKMHDTASSMTTDKARPVDGDVTLCIKCGEFGIFDSAAVGGARKMTEAEEVEIMTSHAAKTAREAWVRMMENCK